MSERLWIVTHISGEEAGRSDLFTSRDAAARWRAKKPLSERYSWGIKDVTGNENYYGIPLDWSDSEGEE